MLRRGDLRLIEGDGKHFVHAMVTHIAGAKQPTAGCLILNVEGAVFGIRQLVAKIITAKKKRTKQVPGWIITTRALG